MGTFTSRAGSAPGVSACSVGEALTTVTIRPANDGDTGALCEIYYDFHEFHVRGVPTHLRSLGERERWDRSDLREALDAILKGDDSEIFVAHAATELVGLAEIHVRQDPDEAALVPHRYAELQSLMVLPPFRRRGVGTRLLTAAERWAREKEATEMRLGVWEFNEAAREFYEALGFKTLKRRMLAELAVDPALQLPASRPRMIRALVFDFDGLILDTELPLFRSWQEIFREHGCDLSLGDWATLLDGSFEPGDPFLRLEACLGRPVDRPVIHSRRIGREHDLLLAQGPLPGVAEMLATARELQLKLAVASNSERAWVTGHLSRLGLLAPFDAIVCADDGTAAKPDPALYLAALDALGVQAAEAIAFEDSPAGILAARRAGVFCVAVPNPITATLPLSLADLVFPSLGDVSLQRLLDLAAEKYARASGGRKGDDGGC